MASVAESITAIDKEFKDATKKVDTAIGNLTSLVNSYSVVGVGMVSSDPPPELLLEKSNKISSIISLVDGLVNQINQIKYTPPAMISQTFRMEDHAIWKSSLAAKIQDSLDTYLEDGGMPSIEFQNAIFNADKERKLQTLNDLYDLADAKIGARGFTYTNSQAIALKLDAQQKHQFDLENISREISKIVTEWAKQIYQFSIEKGISLETFHADFTYKYCTSFVSTYKDLVSASTERFKAELAKYQEPMLAYIQAAQLPLEVDKLNVDISKTNLTAFIEAQKTQATESSTKGASALQHQATTYSNRIQGYTNVAQHLASQVQAVSRAAITVQR